MGLTYHQATYDLLTKRPIDMQRAIENYTQYYDIFVQGFIESGQYTDEIAEQYRHMREQALAWTRLDLFQRPVAQSKQNVEQLDVLEKSYKVQLPASVREWFSLDIVPDIMSAPLP